MHPKWNPGNGNMDRNLRSPGSLILIHTQNGLIARAGWSAPFASGSGWRNSQNMGHLHNPANHDFGADHFGLPAWKGGRRLLFSPRAGKKKKNAPGGDAERTLREADPSSPPKSRAARSTSKACWSSSSAPGKSGAEARVCQVCSDPGNKNGKPSWGPCLVGQPTTKGNIDGATEHRIGIQNLIWVSFVRLAMRNPSVGNELE